MPPRRAKSAGQADSAAGRPRQQTLLELSKLEQQAVTPAIPDEPAKRPRPGDVIPPITGAATSQDQPRRSARSRAAPRRLLARLQDTSPEEEEEEEDDDDDDTDHDDDVTDQTRLDGTSSDSGSSTPSPSDDEDGDKGGGRGRRAASAGVAAATPPKPRKTPGAPSAKPEKLRFPVSLTLSKTSKMEDFPAFNHEDEASFNPLHLAARLLLEKYPGLRVTLPFRAAKTKKNPIQCPIMGCNKEFTTHLGMNYHRQSHLHSLGDFLSAAHTHLSLSPSQLHSYLTRVGDSVLQVNFEVTGMFQACRTLDFIIGEHTAVELASPNRKRPRPRQFATVRSPADLIATGELAGTGLADMSPVDSQSGRAPLPLALLQGVVTMTRPQLNKSSLPPALTSIVFHSPVPRATRKNLIELVSRSSKVNLQAAVWRARRKPVDSFHVGPMAGTAPATGRTPFPGLVCSRGSVSLPASETVAAVADVLSARPAPSFSLTSVETLPGAKILGINNPKMAYALPPLSALSLDPLAQSIVNAGGDIRSLAWAPVAHRDHAPLLAVSATPASPFTDVEPQLSFYDFCDQPGLIQIWSTSDTPTLQMCISHSSGICCDMAWCPAPFGSDLTQDQPPADPDDRSTFPRLGLLACAFSDGTIKIFSVPCPRALQTSWTSFNASLHPTLRCPVIALVPVRDVPLSGVSADDLINGRAPPHASGLCLSWHTHTDGALLAAGLSSGFVVVISLDADSAPLDTADRDPASEAAATRRTSESLLDVAACFRAHLKAVRALSFCPFDGTKLLTASDEGATAIWDITIPSAPLTMTRARSISQSVGWTLLPMGFYYAEDSFLNVCSFEDSITSLSFTRQLEHSGSLMSSDVSTDHGVIASVGSDGVLQAMVNQTYMRHKLPSVALLSLTPCLPTPEQRTSQQFVPNHWRMQLGMREAEKPSKEVVFHPGQCWTSVRWAATGPLLAAGSGLGTVHIIRLT
ncbi:hypothetical protein H696_01568 [Fonticula alba]|uniref:C2H2-type domain-containing protein n=1 Tax=Fonticula alba TaxID=691883 RepID=A0A058ZDY6_FONAL|nr:hypothetical protein H696_01568 [Fonticula alba]KCV72166.1 hypothetical protein H696_01568 [Fonticula alba]|eukprot:XP_009493744.1 hypothetical protein H696_01568 [Fonticula alba]